MTAGLVRALIAGFVGVAGMSVALAQTNKPWVDPPADLSATPPPAAAKPSSAAAPEPAKAEAPKPKPEAEVAKAKPEAEPVKTTSAPKVDTEPTRSAEAVEEAAPPPKVRSKPRTRAAARPRPQTRVTERRVPGERADGLVPMRMQTLEYPDGRRVTVLTPLPPGQPY